MAGTAYKTQPRDWHGRWNSNQGGHRGRSSSKKIRSVSDRVGGKGGGLNFGNTGISTGGKEKKPGLLRRIGRAIKRVAGNVVKAFKREDIEFFLNNGSYFGENGDLYVPADVLDEWQAREGNMFNEQIVTEDLDELEAKGIQIAYEDEDDEDDGEATYEDLDDLVERGVTICVEGEDGELLTVRPEDVGDLYESLDE